MSICRLWQHGHLQKNDTNDTWQGRYVQATLEIKVIVITLGLVLDAAWLFRIVSYVNEDTLLLI